jgi:hypothetical protein
MTQTPPFGTPKPSHDGTPKPSHDGTPKPSHDGTPKPSVDVSTKPAPSSQWWSKPWLWLAAGLAVVALAYGVGRMQGAQALDTVEQRHAAAMASVRSNLEACGVDRSLLNARRSLALVALSLDRRNFGVAESHRREASQALGQPTLSGLPEVANIATTIGALDLGVDPDPGAKREQVIAASEALDKLLTTRARAVVPPVDGSKKVAP